MMDMENWPSNLGSSAQRSLKQVTFQEPANLSEAKIEDFPSEEEVRKRLEKCTLDLRDLSLVYSVQGSVTRRLQNVLKQAHRRNTYLDEELWDVNVDYFCSEKRRLLCQQQLTWSDLLKDSMKQELAGWKLAVAVKKEELVEARRERDTLYNHYQVLRSHCERVSLECHHLRLQLTESQLGDNNGCSGEQERWKLEKNLKFGEDNESPSSSGREKCTKKRLFGEEDDSSSHN